MTTLDTFIAWAVILLIGVVVYQGYKVRPRRGDVHCPDPKVRDDDDNWRLVRAIRRGKLL